MSMGAQMHTIERVLKRPKAVVKRRVRALVGLVGVSYGREVYDHVRK